MRAVDNRPYMNCFALFCIVVNFFFRKFIVEPVQAVIKNRAVTRYMRIGHAVFEERGNVLIGSYACVVSVKISFVIHGLPRKNIIKTIIFRKGKYMQQKSFLRLVSGAFGYSCLANLMSLVVTFSLIGIGESDALKVIAVICSVLLYVMLLFNAGHRDGEIDKKLFGSHKIEQQMGDKWYKIGGLVAGFYCLMCLLLFVFSGEGEGVISVAGGFLSLFRILFPVTMALSILLGDTANPLWAPFVFMAIFALMPFACRLGYWVGFHDKWVLQNMMYIKKK